MNIQNNLQLIGNLGKDAERTNFKNDMGVLAFSFAQSFKYKNNLGEDKEITTWHEAKIFRKQETLDKIEKYFKKGVTVCVGGELRYEEFETKETKQKVIKAYCHVEDFRTFKKGEKSTSQEAPTAEEPA